MYIILQNATKQSLLKCRLKYFYKSISCQSVAINNLPKLFKGHNYFKCENQLRMMASQTNRLFVGHLDRYDGVTVDSSVESCKLEDFSLKLSESLQSWLDAKKRGIWFKVTLEYAAWVPVLAQNGFNFHHANNGFVTMYKWLPDEPHNIPTYAHTMIGVGAVVVNEKREVLVVREKYWLQPHWKLPGGYVEPGENLVDAAIREVFEETNIHTEFRSLINLRHAHNGMFGCSDIYVVIALNPLSTEIKKCDREISESKWLDINEYLNHPDIHDLNKFFIESYIDYQKNNIVLDVKHGIHQILKKPYTVYYVNKNDT